MEKSRITFKLEITGEVTEEQIHFLQEISEIKAKEVWGLQWTKWANKILRMPEDTDATALGKSMWNLMYLSADVPRELLEIIDNIDWEMTIGEQNADGEDANLQEVSEGTADQRVPEKVEERSDTKGDMSGMHQEDVAIPPQEVGGNGHQG